MLLKSVRCFVYTSLKLYTYSTGLKMIRLDSLALKGYDSAYNPYDECYDEIPIGYNVSI